MGKVAESAEAPTTFAITSAVTAFSKSPCANVNVLAAFAEFAEAVESAEKAVRKSGENKLSKIISWFAKLPARIAKPFRNMYYELKKVTWPSKEKLIAYSIIVLVFMLFMGVVIGLLDMGATTLVKMLVV